MEAISSCSRSHTAFLAARSSGVSVPVGGDGSLVSTTIGMSPRSRGDLRTWSALSDQTCVISEIHARMRAGWAPRSISTALILSL